jgi:NAD(P)-dependent dehydrogenase (short-subunit alcohol dehydrogenase family)
MSTTETAVVTGASHGIGAGLVTRFLEKGYNVVGNSRAISDSTNLTPSPQLALVDGDIGDSATAQKITDTAIARFGRIDVLVNNAGLLVSKPFVDYTPGDFEALVSTILAGFFYITQSAAKQMLQQQSGHIVNISISVVDQPIAGVPCAGLALALRELGKLERTFFTLQWLQDPELRRRSHVGLNKGEQQNPLRRAVFFNRLGEIRDRSYENQRHRASGLNLLVAAIILWNPSLAPSPRLALVDGDYR